MIGAASSGYRLVYVLKSSRRAQILQRLRSGRQRLRSTLAWWLSIQKVLSASGLLIVDNVVSHAAEMKVLSNWSALRQVTSP
jgi:hypothetical protein